MGKRSSTSTYRDWGGEEEEGRKLKVIGEEGREGREAILEASSRQGCKDRSPAALCAVRWATRCDPQVALPVMVPINSAPPLLLSAWMINYTVILLRHQVRFGL